MPNTTMLGLLRSTYYGIRGAVILSPWVLHLLCADICLSALLPLSPLLPSFVYDASSVIAGSVWRWIQAIFTRLNSARITTSGSLLPANESAIVISNHLSWTDFYMIQALAIRSNMLGRCRWFAKRQLKWVPFLGWGLWAMGMPLVSRNWVTDRREMESVFGNITSHEWPIWLISYSEATRFSPKKHADTVEWCKQNDKHIPRHTLFPRTKGFVATVQNLRQSKHVKAVYDVTVAYAKRNRFLQTPSFWETISVPRFNDEWRFHAHVERHLVEDLPASDEELARWLEKRWIAKGEVLEDLREKLARGIEWGEQDVD